MGLDVSQLWIGDLLRHREDGKLYAYEDEVSPTDILVRRGRETFVKKISQFESTPIDPASLSTPSQDASTWTTPKTSSRPRQSQVSDEIDLHIRPEEESRLGRWNGAERHFQEQKCRAYLERAHEAGLKSARIIHGKGQGVLKASVIDIVTQSDLVKRWTPVDEGSLEVHF